MSSSEETGIVTPLLKNPVLEVASKILERFALSRLKSHITQSPNYCPLQSAYRAAYSTETAAVDVVGVIRRFVDAGSAVMLVGPDISAASETVNHNLLLRRLEQDCNKWTSTIVVGILSIRQIILCASWYIITIVVCRDLNRRALGIRTGPATIYILRGASTV